MISSILRPSLIGCVMADDAKVNFGYEKVAYGDKAQRVSQVFSDVHANYDLMNDLLSMGLHRLWKRQLVAQLELNAQDQLLDLACGSCDLALLALSNGLKAQQLTLADYNYEMLRCGIDKLINHGHRVRNGRHGHRLPFADQSFTKLTIGFGLRNFVDIPELLNLIEC